MSNPQPKQAEIMPSLEEASRWTALDRWMAVLRGWQISNEALLEVGKWVVDMEAKGHRITAPDRESQGILDNMRKIGKETALPEAWNHFRLHGKLLNRVLLLPTPDQRLLAANGTVSFVEIIDGKTTIRQRNPKDLVGMEIDQVFGECGRINNETQQVDWIKREQAKAERPVPRSIAGFAIDAEDAMSISPKKGHRSSAEDHERIARELRRVEKTRRSRAG